MTTMMTTTVGSKNDTTTTGTATPVVIEYPPPPLLFNGQFEMIRQIGRGSFGIVYLALDLKTKEEVAIKVEFNHTICPRLLYEKRVYQAVTGCGIPRLRGYGQGTSHRFMVLDLMGESLDDLLERCGGRFSMKTVLMLAEQMILRVESFHAAKFIHRDIKPDNFVMGIGTKESVVHIIDFGLAKSYVLQGTEVHVPFRDDAQLTGTVRYASINAHRGFEQSRRDDLEALGYTLIYFLNGRLPWQDVDAPTKKKTCEMISCIKKTTTAHNLCLGLPVEFKEYFIAVKNLRFTEKPNYSRLRLSFTKLFRKYGFRYDNIFDWTNLPVPQTQTASSSSATSQMESKAQPKVPLAPSSGTNRMQ